MDLRTLEIVLGRHLGRMFPWLAKVNKLPGGGMRAPCGFWFSAEPANDPHFD